MPPVAWLIWFCGFIVALIGCLVAETPSKTRELFMTIFGVGANTGDYCFPYSRLHESEAESNRSYALCRFEAFYDAET